MKLNKIDLKRIYHFGIPEYNLEEYIHGYGHPSIGDRYLRMQILGSGNVGIGHFSHSGYKLQIYRKVGIYTDYKFTFYRNNLILIDTDMTRKLRELTYLTLIHKVNII